LPNGVSYAIFLGGCWSIYLVFGVVRVFAFLAANYDVAGHGLGAAR